MKKIMLMASALLITGALLTPAFAQEEQPAQAQASPEAPATETVKPAVPVTKKTVRKKKSVKKAPAQQPAVEVPAQAVSQAPVPVAVAAAEAPQVPQVEAATVAPVAVSTPVKPEVARRSTCPNCFQPLLAGYNGIISDLKPWIDEMEVRAAALDQRLSDIQQRIDEKDAAIEKARLITDKKEAKAAVKSFSKERKIFLTEYTDASDEKDEFYKKFSKEIEKKIEGYNKTVEVKLKTTLSAASQ